MKLEILMLIAITMVNSTDINDGKNVFIPTREWKKINEGTSWCNLQNVKLIESITGQAIPPGLHVRINLQTGLKEAKLLDPEENPEEKSSAIAMSTVVRDEPTQEDNTQEDSKAIHSRLKDALKNIPDDGPEYSEEKLKEITKKFKSYATIKQELEEMDMKIKTDFQLMSDLFGKYDIIQGKSNLDEFGTLFEDLEYLLHQIDNANDFVTAGGLEKVILPNLGNQSIPELRIHSIKLLGVLVQNNPKGQIAAFERNVGSILLQLLSQSTSSSNTNELSSIMFAFGGLLRKFPLAQDELLNNPGLKILVDLLGKQVDFKIKMKCFLLITDLIRDFDDVTANRDLNVTKQYDAIDIKSRLLKTEYCAITVELFSVHLQNNLESLYVADDILDVLIASKDICQPLWNESSVFRHKFLVMKSNYDEMKSETNLDDAELSSVINKLNQLQTFLSNHTVTMTNDEL